jgi:phenylalanyl-tRNA synthetase beta chain
VTFDEARYNSFIDLQDKLHFNIGRRRQLVSIGTHDLDKTSAPYVYTAQEQSSISFVPLSETKEFSVDELLYYYECEKPNCHLKEYVPICQHAPLHPVIFDNRQQVLSLPPLINSEYSKISLSTKNVFIEVTANDLTKAHIVLNTTISMFSQYCKVPFSVESVKIVNQGTGESFLCPDLKDHVFTADPDFINKGIGINIEPEKIAEILQKMQLPTKYDKEKKQLVVHAPPTRSDILHAVDIQEDVAIAYGYNNIKRTVPPVCTVGAPLPLNKLSDQIREVVAQAGFTEVLTWILISIEENFALLNRADPGNKQVTLANSYSAEFSATRTTLLPGLLKVVNSNKAAILPLKIFECGDVVFQDEKHEVGAKNIRHFGALYAGTTSGYEEIHGLIERIMSQNDVSYVNADSDIVKQLEQKKSPQPESNESKDSASVPTKRSRVYYLKKSDDPCFLPGRCAEIFVDGNKVGVFGIFSPKVLKNFAVFPTVCSAMEITIETFL